MMMTVRYGVMLVYVVNSLPHLLQVSYAFSSDRLQNTRDVDPSTDSSEIFRSTIEAEVNRMMINEEHRGFRNALRRALNILDMEDINDNENFISDHHSLDTGSDMPFYVEHMKHLIRGKDTTEKRRNHRKRNTFDSIGHQSEMGGLGSDGGSTRRRKPAFTFENLLPYLIEEMRRTNRAVTRRY